MIKTLLTAKWVLEGFEGDTPKLHEDAALLVVDGKVAEIGSADRLSAAHPGARREGSNQSAIVPGFINAHHHIGLTPFQLGSPDHPLEYWFVSRLGLRALDLYLDTLYSAFEMIASGVTTVQHLHSRAPGGADGLYTASRQVLKAYQDIGMRASFSMAIRDQNRLVYEDDKAFLKRLPEHLQPSLAAYFDAYTVPLSVQFDLFETLKGELADQARIGIQLAPSNLHWLSDKALESLAELSQRHNAPMHAHLMETHYQKQYAQMRTGGSALRYLDQLGLTGPNLTIGHGVWMTEEDIEICAHSGTHICHNCSSNMRLKSGIAPVNRFLEKGIPVALGIDEAGINDDRDMLQEMRLALRMHRVPGLRSPAPSAAQILRMATQDGAATTPFDSAIGRLSQGSWADLVMFDWREVTWPYQDPTLGMIDVLVHRAKTSAVKMVMIAGDIVYANGRFTNVERDAVLSEISEILAGDPTEQETIMRDLSKAIFPIVREFYDQNYEIKSGKPFYNFNDSGL
jgi:cytosine/adenosine deaminase-related metal-dependent hydrolase